MTATFSSREFNQDASKIKRAAGRGPVFITERGKPSHVLLSIEEYRRLTHQGPTILQMIGPHEADFIEFEPEPLKGPLVRPVEFD